MSTREIAVALLIGFVGVFVYRTFTDPIVIEVERIVEVEVTSDESCVAWLFNTNLKNAKARMCGRKVK